jgi:hypothetical protein
VEANLTTHGCTQMGKKPMIEVKWESVGKIKNVVKTFVKD